jgi:hypothetical protein
VQWWQAHDIGASAEIRKEVQHPLLGTLVFEQTAYTTLDSSGVRLVLHLPMDLETSQKLQQIEMKTNSE